MLMKLALFDDQKIEPDIVKCCEHNKVHYVPIIKNRFGILTDSHEMTFGRDDALSEPEINSKAFINVYKCAVDIVNKRKLLFWKDKSYSPYNGKILDNLFFKRIITYCNQHSIPIIDMEIISEFNTPDNISDADEIKEIASQKGDFIIKKLVIDLKKKSITFNKVGYVIIASKLDFYEENKETILSMLKVGLGE